MAKFLVDGKADMISAFYTINLDRFEVVDFTFPALDYNYAFAIKSKCIQLCRMKTAIYSRDKKGS